MLKSDRPQTTPTQQLEAWRARLRRDRELRVTKQMVREIIAVRAETRRIGDRAQVATEQLRLLVVDRRDHAGRQRLVVEGQGVAVDPLVPRYREHVSALLLEFGLT